MFIELVDQLRCPREHELTWLVASIDRSTDRDIIDGTLGCPTCGSRYPVVRGVADLRVSERRSIFDARARGEPPTAEQAIRLAAMLDLVEPGGFVVLAGEWGAMAPALAAAIGGVHALTVNARGALAGVPGVSAMLAADGLPVRAGAARGVALDDRHGTDECLRDAVAALRTGGRLVAPAAAALPADVTAIARDDRYVVAIRATATGAPVPLTRGGRPR